MGVKSKTKRPAKTTTQSKTTPASKRQSVTRIKKSTPKPKKSTVKKAVAKRPSKKPIQKTVVPVVDSITKSPSSRVSGLTQPLTVEAIAAPMLKRSAYVHPWSLRHNVTVILSLTLVAVIAMVAIATFTQSALSDIEALNTPSTTLMKPTATETRFFTTAAGEVKLTLPTSWSFTEHVDETITYKHGTLPDTQIQVQVINNTETDVASWLEETEPAYENQLTVESAEAVTALRGMTVRATNSEGIPVQVVYLPIQKNLRERYIVAIAAQVPLDSSVAATEAFNDIIANFQVE